MQHCQNMYGHLLAKVPHYRNLKLQSRSTSRKVLTESVNVGPLIIFACHVVDEIKWLPCCILLDAVIVWLSLQLS